MLLNDLLYEIEVQSEIPDITVEAVTTDPEKIQNGTLLILLHTATEDNNLIKKLKNSPPRAIVCEERIFEKTDILQITVTDIRKAYARIFYNFYFKDKPIIKIIGVSGTNGKTTTSMMLREILLDSYIKCGYIGTGKIMIGEKNVTEKDYSMTTPDPELLYSSLKKMQDDNCKYAIMEVSSHSIALKKVEPLTFECIILTGIEEDHLDFHKTREEYARTKLSLFKKTSLAIINADDKILRDALFTYRNNSIAVGSSNECEVKYKKIKSSLDDKTEFIYETEENKYTVTLNMSGDYNILNASLAITASLKCGVCSESAIKALSNDFYVEGRMEKVCNNPVVYIDYAHTTDALYKTMCFLYSTVNIGQNIISVFGCGGERDRGKRPMAAEICEKFSTKVIVTSDNPRKENEINIFCDIIRGFKNAKSFRLIPDRDEAIRYAIKIAKKNDVIILLGKGHERYLINNDGYQYFDEREIVKDEVKKSGYENQA